MIYAVDVGSTLNGRNGIAFAWAKVPRVGGQPMVSVDPEALTDSIASDLRVGEPVAIGLEAPLYLPVPTDVTRLSRGRQNERDRSCFAPAGGYVATLALHQTAWLLRRLRSSCEELCDLTVEISQWPPIGDQRPVLFFWEAFVSGPAHMNHTRDAATAAMYFQASQMSLATEITAEDPISLFGSAVLWSGWSTDLGWLHRSLLTLRPRTPWEGDLGVA